MEDVSGRDAEALACFLLEAWEIVSGLEKALEFHKSTPAAAAKLQLLAGGLLDLERAYAIPGPAALARVFLETPDGPSARLDEALSLIRSGLEALEAPGGKAVWPELSKVEAAPAPALDKLTSELRLFGANHADVLEYFGPDATEQINELQNAVSLVKDDPSNAAAVEQAFRYAHRLKGDALTVGCEPLAALAAPIEKAFLLMREKQIPVQAPLVDALQVGAWLLSDVMKAVYGGRPGHLEERCSRLGGHLEKLLTDLTAAPAPPPPAEPLPEPEPELEPQPPAAAVTADVAAPKPVSGIDADLLSGFFNEMTPLIASLRRELSGVVSGDSGAAHRLYVLSHRMQGSSALYGLSNLSKISASLEKSAADIASLDPRAARAIIDKLEAILESVETTGVEGVDADAFLAAQVPEAGFAAEPAPSLTDPLEAELKTFRKENAHVLDYYAPETEEHIDALREGLEQLENEPDPLTVASVFRHAHSLKGDALTVGCQPVARLAHAMEDVLELARQGAPGVASAAVPSLLAGTELLREMLAVVLGASRSGLPARLEKALADLAEARAPKAAAAGPEMPATAVAPRPAAPPVAAATAAAALPEAAFRTTIRVSLGRIESLMNLSGELIVAREQLEKHLLDLSEQQAALEQSRERLSTLANDLERTLAATREREPAVPAETTEIRPSLERIFTSFELDRFDEGGAGARRIGEISADLLEIRTNIVASIDLLQTDTKQIHDVSRDLREAVSRTRMVPVGQLFARSERVVLRLAADLGKKVRIETSGEASEIDSSVMSELGEPLLHIFQNAVVHGLEPEAERVANGKPAEGLVSVRAQPRGRYLQLEISDDGRGIDLGFVRARAKALGLVREDPASLTDGEAMQLIFRPGFTTAEEVTERAGRGVGLDVVRTTIARLNGSVEVTSKPGHGTTFSFRLPLTLMVTEVLEIAIGPHVFAVPLAVMRQVADVPVGSIVTKAGQESVEILGEEVPLYRSSRVFGHREEDRPTVRVVVLNAAGRLFGLTIDESLRIRQAVIKDLGGLLSEFHLFPGATVSIEGKPILVLDALVLWDTLQANVRPVEMAAEEDTQIQTKKRILLVDDSLSVRKIVGRMLEEAGFDVMTAPDGEDAIDLLRTKWFDAIITDLEMPRVNGYELLDYLKRHPHLATGPVIVISTRAAEKHARLAKDLGATACLSKPVDAQQLLPLLGAPSFSTSVGGS